MEHIFEAFQNSFQPDEKVIFISNVKDEKNAEGDLILTSKRLCFYPAKPNNISDVMYVNIELITEIQITDKGILISNGQNKGTYEMEILKEDFIEKFLTLNNNVKVS